jgi:DNA replication protein DnaC
MPVSEATAELVVETGKRCSLTKSVLAEWAQRGTPRQVEFLLGYLEAEAASRDASKRASLLRRCALPAPKTFEGYDWTAVSWPEGFGREDLLGLSFMSAREDLVLMGDVGTGKTHMASALCALACSEKREARFFTASSLVMRLRRARDDGRLDRELSQIGRAELLVIDELGFLPLDEDGARLLFQVVSGAYETQSVVFTTNSSSPAGAACSATTRWPPPSSTASSTTAACCASGASRTASGTPSCREVLRNPAHLRCENCSETDANSAQMPLTEHICRRRCRGTALLRT